MPDTDAARADLYNRLQDVLGPPHADTLMDILSRLPPEPIVTTTHLAATEARINHRFDLMEERFVGIDQRFEDVDRRFEDVDRRFEAVDRRFESIDRRLDGIDQRLSIEFSTVHDRIDRLFISQVAGIVAIVAAIFAQAAIF